MKPILRSILFLMGACTAPDSYISQHTSASCDVDASVDAGPQPPPKTCIAILGQSNAQGKGKTTDLSGTDLDAAHLFAPVVYNANIVSNTTVPLGDGAYDTGGGGGQYIYSYGPLSPYSYEGQYKFGVELTMGRDLEAAWPGVWAVTKWAQGGAELGVHLKADALYPSTDPNIPNVAMMMRLHVESAYEADHCERLVVVWIQGETDAKYLADAQTYQANLAAFVAFFRQKWPDSYWLIGKLSSAHVTAGNHNGQYTAMVQAAEAAYVATDPLSRLVDQDSIPLLTSDYTHFTSVGYLQLGHDYAQAVLALP